MAQQQYIYGCKWEFCCFLLLAAGEHGSPDADVVSLLDADGHCPCGVKMFAISWSVAENAVQLQALQRGNRASQGLLCSKS